MRYGEAVDPGGPRSTRRVRLAGECPTTRARPGVLRGVREAPWSRETARPFTRRVARGARSSRTASCWQHRGDRQGMRISRKGGLQGAQETSGLLQGAQERSRPKVSPLHWSCSNVGRSSATRPTPASRVVSHRLPRSSHRPARAASDPTPSVRGDYTTRPS